MRAALLFACFVAACQTFDNTNTARIAVGSQLLVVDAGEGLLETMNPQNGSYIWKYPVAPQPELVTITPDGRTAVVASHGPDGSWLTVANLPEREIRQRVDLETYGRARGLSFCDARVRVAIPMEGSGQLLLVNVQSGRVTEQIDAGLVAPRGVTIARDRARAFVGDGDVVVAVDLQSGTVAGRTAVGDGVVDVGRRPRSGQVWAASASAGQIWIIDEDSLEVLGTIDCGGEPVALSFAKRGKMAVVANASTNTIQLYDAAELSLIEEVPLLIEDLTGADLAPADVLCEPDGHYAFVPIPGADRVAVIDLDTREVVGSYPTKSTPVGVAFTFIQRAEWDINHDN